MAATDHYVDLPGEEVGSMKGQMIWTGPDGVRDYKAHVVSDYEYIGETVKQNSSTTSMKFLNRDAQGAQYPPRRAKFVGEIGWMVDDMFMNKVNADILSSGNQIQLKVFRKALEDDNKHRFQNPYVPAPDSGEPLWPQILENKPGVSGYPPGMPLQESMGFVIKEHTDNQQSARRESGSTSASNLNSR